MRLVLGNAPLKDRVALKNAHVTALAGYVALTCVYFRATVHYPCPTAASSHSPLVRCLFFLQLSTRYAEEGIEFSCLCQSDQDALQADVRSQLYHAAGHGAGAAPNWEELSITMQAYGGVTSVGLVRNGGNGKTPNGGKNLVVSPIG